MAPQSKLDGSVPPALDLLLGGSPTAHHSRRLPGGDHSRRVSWDDTILESAAGASGFDTGKARHCLLCLAE